METTDDISEAADDKLFYTKKVNMTNLFKEREIIRMLVSSGKYPYVAIDTEYPGVVYKSPTRPKSPDERYANLKLNVDRLRLIQIGLTLSDADGNLPRDEKGNFFSWEFNLRDFDIRKHCRDDNAIELLTKAEFDFDDSSRDGIPASLIATLLVDAGLVQLPENGEYPEASQIVPLPVRSPTRITWITFQGEYDFAFLTKVVRDRWKHAMTLPKSLSKDRMEFLAEMKTMFGESIYDIKEVMRTCDGIHGGLETVANCLGVRRPCGKGHQAGSDSLLSSRVFFKMMKKGFSVAKHKGILFGLE